MFHLKLDEMMEERGLSNTGLAEQIGVSRVTVWHWRTGRRKPSHVNMARLVSVLSNPTGTWWALVSPTVRAG
jgi:predicted transcriptional regulator